MIKALWGKCDGTPITFRKDLQGRWETSVPASPDAQYIIELWAEDYAGNVGYFATVKYAYDATKMCMCVFVLDVGEKFSIEDVKSVFRNSVMFKEYMNLFKYDLLPEKMKFKIVKCEVCRC